MRVTMRILKRNDIKVKSWKTSLLRGSLIFRPLLKTRGIALRHKCFHTFLESYPYLQIVFANI